MEYIQSTATFIYIFVRSNKTTWYKKTKQQKAKISNRHKYEVTDKQQQQTFYEVYLLIFLSFSLVKLV